MSRFSQADTLVPGTGSPMLFDRYAGMMNNPLKFIDPSGFCSTDLYDEYYDYECIQLAEELSDLSGLPLDDWINLDYDELVEAMEEYEKYADLVNIPDDFKNCIQVGDEIWCAGTPESNWELIKWSVSMLPYELEKRGIDLTLGDLNVNLGNLNIKVEGAKIDLLDLAISGGGALADPLSLFFPQVQVPAMIVEAADAAKGTSDLLKGDPSGLLLQATESQLQRVIIVVLKWERVAPIFGWFGSTAEILINVGSATTITIIK